MSFVCPGYWALGLWAWRIRGAYAVGFSRAMKGWTGLVGLLGYVVYKVSLAP